MARTLKDLLKGGSSNKNLRKAARKKNDEFYTRLVDIEQEIKHYKTHFKNKIVFCNCDDPNWSAFAKYFGLNFDVLGLKKVITTHYEKNHSSYKLEIHNQLKSVEELDKLQRVPLVENGDFRSQECIDILQEADIVSTNPPFSLFREYISQLINYNKNFLIIGNSNSIICKDIFPLVKENRIWFGHNFVKEFIVPDGSTKKFGNVTWYTNLTHSKRNEELIPVKTYKGNEILYPAYDNYAAIDVSRVVDIPADYDGIMGVPVSFLNKYNPKQFEILGLTNTGEENLGIRYKNTEHGRALVNGKEIYTRLLIRHRKTEK